MQTNSNTLHLDPHELDTLEDALLTYQRHIAPTDRTVKGLLSKVGGATSAAHGLRTFEAKS